LSEVYHGMVFTFAFLIIAAVVTSAVASAVLGALRDVQQIMAVAERANERLRVAAVYYRDGQTYYMVRSLTMRPLTVAELGASYPWSARQVITTSVQLSPGGEYYGTVPGRPQAIYAVTQKGNIFAAPVIDLSTPGQVTASISSLAPYYTSAVVGQVPGLGGAQGFTYGVSASAYPFAFGFVVGKTPGTAQNAVVFFGPYDVPQILERDQLPFMDSRSATSGSLSLSASFRLEARAGGGGGSPSYFRLSMPISFRSGGTGMVLQFCLGIAWLTATSDITSLRLDTQFAPSLVGGPDYRISYGLASTLIPAATADMGAIMAKLSDLPRFRLYQQVSAPAGASVLAVLARCASIEDTSTSTFTTTDGTPYTTVRGVTIYTELNFPQRNWWGGSGGGWAVDLNSFSFTLSIDPRAVLWKLLAYG